MSSSLRRIDALRAALAVDSDDLDLRTMLADTLLEVGRADEAIEELRVVAGRRPTADVKLKLARAYASAGDRRRAEAVLEDLERNGGMTPDAWKLRASLVGLGMGAPLGDAPVSTQPLAAPSFLPFDDEDDAEGEDHGVAADVETDDDEPFADRLERPRITFADVGGMEDLKEAIRLKILYPAQNPEIYRAYGKSAGGGLLLYGPPGCGKTHIARATAGELSATFISVGVADVLEMWIGSSERNLRAIFATARAHRPCVLFFDEIDALAADRANFTNTAGRSVINQFLAEFDGIGGDNTDILILGATNAPWHVDSAFRRPGRFDQVLFVPPPDPEARAEILRVQLRDRPVGNVDIGQLVRRTEAFSGADLRGLVERALEAKVAAALRDGKVRPLETDDLVKAAKSLTPTTREWFATIKNYILYANQGGLYDAVRDYIDR